MKFLTCVFIFMAPFFVVAQSKDSLAVAVQVDSMIKLSRTLCDQKKFDEAFILVDQAEKISIEKFGNEHIIYANCIFNKGRIKQLTLKLKEAEPYYVKARELRGKILGKEHNEYASVTNNLAIIYRQPYRYDESIALFKEVLAIKEKKFGKEHIEYGKALNNLGGVYLSSKKYDEAEIAFLEVKKILEAKVGKEDIEYARNLNNLASLYKDQMSRFGASEALYLETKAIQETKLSKDSIPSKQTTSDYCWTLSNLGDLYRLMGHFEQSESLTLQANETRLKILGKDHPDYASGLNNLGLLYSLLGNYENAEPLYREALELRSKQVGKNDPRYGRVANNLAVMYTDMDYRPEAEPLYLEVKDIFEKNNGKESTEYTTTVNNLAILYLNQKKYPEAENFLNEARQITEKTLGINHPDFANTLEDLSLLKTKTKNLPEALKLRTQAVSIFEKSLGNEHNRYAQNLFSLAELEGVTGNTKQSEIDFSSAAAIQRKIISKSTRFLSERELSSFTALFKRNIDINYSFASRNPSAGLMSQTCYNNSLLYKGFLLNASFKIKKLGRTNKEIAEKFDILSSYNSRINEALNKPISERDETAIQALQEKSSNLEKELVKQVAGLGDAMKETNWEQVRSALKPGEAAVEFIHFKLRYPEEMDSIIYAALILKPGSTSPEFVTLFVEKSLDSLLVKQTERNEIYVKLLYSLEGRGAEAVAAPHKTLYELIWKPIQSKFQDTKKIYISSSGLMHRLNLGAIPVTEEETLSDRYQFVNLASTRQLVNRENELTGGAAPVLFGGIVYEMDSLMAPNQNFGQGADLVAMRRTEAQIPPESQVSRGGSWNFLKYTIKEVNSISNILALASMKPELHTGKAATEELVKALGSQNPSPSVIHIATHGFFFPDPKESKTMTNSGDKSASNYKISEQPMIRSGIVLAGGNYAWKNGTAYKPGMEDGILTALEISQMNLSQTELVVLSACETGLGDIKGNEGVYGLQRAFKIAGVKYLLMSLWQVPDRETMEFMTTFYSHWLTDKLSIPEAYSKTQKEMKDRFLNPFSWAGFILLE